MARLDRPQPWFVFSISTGNFMQLGGLVGSLALVWRSRLFHPLWATRWLMLGWLVNYFCNHAIAHWAVGRIVGIHFVGYGVHGTTSPSWYPPGLRWIFAHLPFFSARADAQSLRAARPTARLTMYLAGPLFTLLNGLGIPLYALAVGIPHSRALLGGAMVWFTPMLIVESLRRGGDLRRAWRELRRVRGNDING